MVTMPCAGAVQLLFVSMLAVTLSEEDRCVYTLTNVPYITFMGEQLPNHSFLYIEMLGNGSNVLQCHTDLTTCCGDSHSGEWTLPNGLVVGPSVTAMGYSVRQGEQRVELAYNSSDGRASGLEGIYRCSVPTNARNDVADTARESVYVGLYSADGKLQS